MDEKRDGQNGVGVNRRKFLGTNPSSQSQLYYNDFFNLGSNNGSNIQGELYNLTTSANNGAPTKQVAAAIQAAFTNYRSYLVCSNQNTGNNGTLSSCGIISPVCPPTYLP